MTSEHDLGSTAPDRLAHLLRMSDGDAPLWSERELAAIFRHQMSAPVGFDLSALPGTRANTVAFAAAAQGLVLKSFADLLHHPHPPVQLLSLTKEFAKAHRNQPDNPLPREVSTLLYFASIAAALVRCRVRITTLDADELTKSFRWGAGLDWIDENTRRLFNEALAILVQEGRP